MSFHSTDAEPDQRNELTSDEGSKAQDISDEALRSLRAHIEGIANPALVVDKAGAIRVINSRAHVGIAYDEGNFFEDIQVFMEPLHSLQDPLNPFSQDNKGEIDAGFIITVREIEPSREYPALWIIELEETFWHRRVTETLTRQFGLTDKELRVLRQVIVGLNFDQIAKNNSIAISTARKHFYTAAEKINVSGKNCAMARYLSIARQAIRKPTAKFVGREPAEIQEAAVFRNGDRQVEIRVAGPKDGRPVIGLNGAFFIGVTPKQLDLLYQKGIQLFTLVRPGFGRTDPKADGQTTIECLKSDFEYLLNNFCERDVAVYAPHAAFGQFLNFAGEYSDRIQKIITTHVMLPSQYRIGDRSRSPAIAALGTALYKRPFMVSRVYATVFSMFSTKSLNSLLRMLLPNIPILNKPDGVSPGVALAAESLQALFIQGPAAIREDYELYFNDWRADLRDCGIDVVNIREFESPLMTDVDYEDLMAGLDGYMRTVVQTRHGSSTDVLLEIL